MTQATSRRPRRTSQPVAVGDFQDQVDKAITAFETDATYSVLMARAAVTIARKREIWQARHAAA